MPTAPAVRDALDVLEVLIIGAGPTGLMLALQLARRGVKLRIVDRQPGPAQETRAVVVQARTLEFFHQMGFGDEAVRAGRAISRVCLLQGGRVRAELPVGRLGLGRTRYPFALALGQDQTEALLIAKLRDFGVEVERSTEATSIEDMGALLRVRLHAGETIDVPWLCGCDGASSTVRHAMGIGFEGGTYEHRFYLTDCRVDGPIPDDGVSVCPDARSFVAFFAMAGERRFRVIGRLPSEHAGDSAGAASAPPASLPFEAIAPLAARASGLPLALSHPRWTSLYRLHHRCAEKLRAGREGRVFILGDAAHVHSPVGGQGMNTGLQDATNLAWKLAMVVRGGASPALASSFEEERLPVARRLLRTTDRIFTFATNEGALARIARMFVVRAAAPRLLRIGRVRDFAFRVISQTGIAYGEGSCAAAARRGGASTAPSAAAPGERLPFAEIASGDGAPRDLAEFCRAPWFTAIVVGFPASKAADALAELAAEIAAFPAIAPFIALRSIPAIEANRVALALFGVVAPDADADRASRDAFASARLVIVRPDLHVFGHWPIERTRDALAALRAAVGAAPDEGAA